MNINDLHSFLSNITTDFKAECSPAEINFIFQNSNRRGEPKSFSISIGSIIKTLTDIKDNISTFQHNVHYVEKEWRDLGSEYYTDPIANAFSTVQTKPLFTLLSKIIFWANDLEAEGKSYIDNRVYITQPYLDISINKLSQLNNPFLELYDKLRSVSNITDSDNKRYAKNLILYGAPGTGKTYKIDQLTKGKNNIKTTFHPESDYSSFVGSYKPIMDGENIKYNFTPQAFTKAYTKAWKNLNEPYFLIIDEINRANCAQAFGDIFQLLDRREDGFSEYLIDVDHDLELYLERELAGPDYINNLQKYYPDENISISRYSKIALPSNLYLFATMNTSDQSLFPMDSAFKRRWSWEYIPIDIDDANKFVIKIGNKQYSWGSFISIINSKIESLKLGSDKKLGNRFVNPSSKTIDTNLFRSKILFYLWDEIYKDELESSVFSTLDENDNPSPLNFDSFFPLNDQDKSKAENLIQGFMRANNIPEIETKNSSEEILEEEV